jgi:hypothetical protein
VSGYRRRRDWQARAEDARDRGAQGLLLAPLLAFGASLLDQLLCGVHDVLFAFGSEPALT